MIDASSVAKEDLLPYTLHFPGRTGYNYAAKHNPQHRLTLPQCMLQFALASYCICGAFHALKRFVMNA